MSEELAGVHLVKILLDIPLFEDMDYSQITALVEAARQRELSQGDVLCEPRTIDNRLIVFLKGRLRLESAGGEKLSDLVPVRIIGEMGVFTGQTRSSRVVADGPCTVLELDAEMLQDLVEEDPQMGNHLMVNLIKLLYERVHDMNEDLAVSQEVGERLRRRLEELAPDDPLLGELFPGGASEYEG